MTFDSTVHQVVLDRLSLLNRKDYRHVFTRAFAPQQAIEPTWVYGCRSSSRTPNPTRAERKY